MKWKKMLLAAGLFSGLLFVNGVQSAWAAAGIEKVTVITDVFGDGEKPSQVVLQYPRAMTAKNLSTADYTVEGRTLSKVTTSSQDRTADGKDGRYVFLDLLQQNTVYDGDLANRPGHQDKAKEEKKPDGGVGVDAPMISDRVAPDLSVKVRQVKDVKAADGKKFSKVTKDLSADETREPVLDRFKQYTYTDPATGYTMPYNLYLPENYDPSKKYPLLFFVADASANINNTKTPLFQGNGATVWTSPEEQAKHPCIVLAPQYTQDMVDKLGMMTTDKNQWTSGLTLVTHLLQQVIKDYPVDTDRIYGTGQSQGGMTNIAISDRYPNLFAAQWLVACQWDTSEMEALKDKNLWITVCEGDNKAYPGMNEAVAKWRALGTTVAQNTEFWDSKAPVAELDQKVKELTAQGSKINYTVFAGGNHMYTWSFAYNIDAIRDWLFAQKK